MSIARFQITSLPLISASGRGEGMSISKQRQGQGRSSKNMVDSHMIIKNFHYVSMEIDYKTIA